MLFPSQDDINVPPDILEKVVEENRDVLSSLMSPKSLETPELVIMSPRGLSIDLPTLIVTGPASDTTDGDKQYRLNDVRQRTRFALYS